VDHASFHHRLDHGEHLLPDPGHGEVAEDPGSLLEAQGVPQGEVARNELAVGEHGQLAPGGGARGGGQESDLVWVAALQVFGHLLGLAEGFAEGADLPLKVPAHPRLLPDQNEVHKVQVGQDLIQLFLVREDDAPGVGELEEIPHLLRHGIRVDAHGVGPKRLGGKLAQHPFGGVVAQNGQNLPFLKPHGLKPRRQALGFFPKLSPARLLPDAVPFDP